MSVIWPEFYWRCVQQSTTKRYTGIRRTQVRYEASNDGKVCSTKPNSLTDCSWLLLTRWRAIRVALLAVGRDTSEWHCSVTIVGARHDSFTPHCCTVQVAQNNLYVSCVTFSVTQTPSKNRKCWACPRFPKPIYTAAISCYLLGKFILVYSLFYELKKSGWGCYRRICVKRGHLSASMDYMVVVERSVFIWRTIAPNFIPIRFETTEL